MIELQSSQILIKSSQLLESCPNHEFLDAWRHNLDLILCCKKRPLKLDNHLARWPCDLFARALISASFPSSWRGFALKSQPSAWLDFFFLWTCKRDVCLAKAWLVNKALLFSFFLNIAVIFMAVLLSFSSTHLSSSLLFFWLFSFFFFVCFSICFLLFLFELFCFDVVETNFKDQSKRIRNLWERNPNSCFFSRVCNPNQNWNPSPKRQFDSSLWGS